jgi:hypothetical protein
MPYIGTDINYGNLAKQTGTGDGADTTPIAALTYTVPSSESILVFLDGVCQVPSTDFTATGTTLTFTTAPANGVAILVMFLGRSLDIGTPADNTVGLAQLAGGTDGNLITYDASGDPANVATGTATHVLTSNGAGAAPTFQAASGGDKRNFWIDGDYTQFPDYGGASTSWSVSSGSGYLSALHQTRGAVSGAVFNYSRDTDVPTVGQSGHLSKYALKIDCTTADGSVGSSDLSTLEYVVTGSDYAFLHGQAITLNFWVKSTKTGTFGVCFQNSARDRSYVAEYTVSSTNTWEEKSVSVTLDTSGTWLLTEADVGLRIILGLMAGSSFHTGTLDQWNGDALRCSSNQVNVFDSTSNNFHLSQVGLYLGSSAPSTFLGESVSTVRNQVAWYVQRHNLDQSSYEPVCAGYSLNATDFYGSYSYPMGEMRKQPSITDSAVDTFAVWSTPTTPDATTITWSSIGTSKARVLAQGHSVAVGEGGLLTREATNTTWIMMDARH